MIKTASKRGVELCVIDYGRPLLEQGHYDAIVHKLRPNKGAALFLPAGAGFETPPKHTSMQQHYVTLVAGCTAPLKFFI